MRVFYTYQAVRDIARKFAGPSVDGTYLLSIVKYLNSLAKYVRDMNDRVITEKHVASFE